MAESETLELDHGAGVTRLAIGRDEEWLRGQLADWVADRTVFVITSGPVWELHGQRCLTPLEETTKLWKRLEVPDGEAAKSPAVAEDLWRRMLASGARRDSRVITFGGGSVGDLGGFVAGTFMRGVELCHVPTTLLAQVDAAIGGKSAVNLPEAKNSVGVFCHPDRVVSATDLLETLPARELGAGLVEVIKMAALIDLQLFERLEGSVDGLLKPGSGGWVPVVAAAQRAKAGVVERDPRESGERRVLNFGHTLGHAIEASLDYGVMLHGEAVAWGMRFAIDLASARGLDPSFAHRIDSLLETLSIPPLPALSAPRLMDLAGRDKKADREGIGWVLPTGPGEWEFTHLEPGETLARLEQFLARRGPAC